MARFYFTIATLLSIGQILPRRSQVTASVVQPHQMERGARLWPSQGDESKQKTQQSEDLRLGASSQDWRATCLSFSINQTLQGLNRKGHISLLSRSFSQQLAGKHNVYETNQAGQRTFPGRNANPWSKGKRDPGGIKGEFITKRIFANIVKRRRNIRGVVMRFVLHGTDISKLTSAKLWAYNTCRERARQTVLVMKLHGDGKKRKRCGSKLIKLYKKFVSREPGKRTAKGWKAIDVTLQINTLWKDLKRACKKSTNNGFRLLIKSPRCASLGVRKTTDGKKWGAHLALVTADEPPRIIPRKISVPLECTPGEKRCCRERETVSLDELEESPSRVVMPTTFQVNKCRGLCSINPSSGQPATAKPCCVPTKTSPFSMIAFEENSGFSKETWVDAAVEECGCV